MKSQFATICTSRFIALSPSTISDKRTRGKNAGRKAHVLSTPKDQTIRLCVVDHGFTRFPITGRLVRPFVFEYYHTHPSHRNQNVSEVGTCK